MVSFSIAQSDMKEESYALFGGYNSSQIVEGAKGLKTFKNYPNLFGTWALLGQGLYYGDEPIVTTQSEQVLSKGGHVAIVDTGSSQLSVPPSVFEGLQAKWKEDIPNLTCKKSHTFCHVNESCESVV
mmetsp:Transcript_2201/g.3307  ORF Transcript_2201/g.3307 Transcript_2201/m.3307 type:complete len:127 (+) Transcript_2201:1401-1781(+)